MLLARLTSIIMAANLRQAPANLKHFRGMLDFSPTQLKSVVQSAIALKKVGPFLSYFPTAIPR